MKWLDGLRRIWTAFNWVEPTFPKPAMTLDEVREAIRRSPIKPNPIKGTEVEK